MLNAPGAVEAALRPIAAIAAPATVPAGRPITLSAAGSAAACGSAITQYEWSVVSGPGAVSSPATADTTVQPTGPMVVRLTVTDDAGRQDSADITITTTTTSTTAPADAGTNACPAEVPPIGVIVEPQTISLVAGNSVSFTANVIGVAADDEVTWQVNGIAGGNATVGSISASGVYTAPAAVPNPPRVTVTAISNADMRATGSAVVTVTAPPASSSTPAPSGGGGAAPDLLLLLALAPASAAAMRRRRFRR